jgi:FkbH-like protein
MLLSLVCSIEELFVMTEHATATALPSLTSEGDNLRQSFLSQLKHGRMYEAIRVAHSLLELQPGRRTHRFLRDALDSPATAVTELKQLKVALLSSFSIEFIQDSLVALGLLGGLRIEIYKAGFGTFRQELLDAGSALYAWSPDAVVLAVEGEDWVPAAFGVNLEAPEGGFDEVSRRFNEELSDLIKAFRIRSTAPLLIHNLALPSWRTFGILDPKLAQGQGAIISQFNAALSAVARDAADVHVVDYAGLVNRHGATNWYDERMKLYAKAPIANAMQPHLSAEYIKYFAALKGLAKKCLVLDLDNTLWGGVIGEDGVDGIQLGPNYPGNSYVEFQRYVLALQKRGVILAIASKNNPADVDEILSGHRFMVLRKEHFANLQVHWEAKSQSLVRIAEQLSIGLEHMVFVDDNPAECEEVRRALPMVRVLQLPSQPERYVRVLQEAGLFDTLTLSTEDRRRGDLYRQRALAEAARLSMTSVEDYYRDLAMELTIAPVDKANLPRAAQLTQKTNQFNVTTLRYSEADVAKRMEDARWIVATVTVKDRFGDNGIVGVVMAQEDNATLKVDTLLLSCRVIGRTVETAMLAHLCDQGRSRGLKALTARFVPTSKNAPSRDIFERHGFAKVNEDESGATFWHLDLGAGDIAWPTWFKRVS